MSCTCAGVMLGGFMWSLGWCYGNGNDDGMRMSGRNVAVTLVTNEPQKKPWCFGKTCGSFG